jgi:hypothetical protein
MLEEVVLRYSSPICDCAASARKTNYGFEQNASGLVVTTKCTLCGASLRSVKHNVFDEYDHESGTTGEQLIAEAIRLRERRDAAADARLVEIDAALERLKSKEPEAS